MPKIKRNTRVTVKPKRGLTLPTPAQWKYFVLALIPVVFIVVIVSARLWLQNPNNLRINDIEIKGETKFVDRQQVHDLAVSFANTNLYLLNAQELAKELEAEPWIRSVAITKLWPATMLIEISEQQAIAFWGDDRMVNPYGEVFDAYLPEMRGVMPVLYHPDEKGIEMVNKYKQIQHWLSALPVGVSAFIEDASGAWRLRLTNDITVQVGSEERQKRLRRLVVGYLSTLQKENRDVATIDLRYTNGFAVDWR